MFEDDEFHICIEQASNSIITTINECFDERDVKIISLEKELKKLEQKYSDNDEAWKRKFKHAQDHLIELEEKLRMQMGQPETSKQADSMRQRSTLSTNCSIVCKEITGKHRITETLSAKAQQKLQMLIENKETGLQQQQVVLTQLAEWLHTQCRTLKIMEETIALQHSEIVEKDKMIKSLSEAMQKRIESKINHHMQLEERLLKIEKLTAIIARLQTPPWALSGLKEILKM